MTKKWEKSLRSRTRNIMRLSFVRFISTQQLLLSLSHISEHYKCVYGVDGDEYETSVEDALAHLLRRKKAVKWSEKRKNGREMRHNSEHNVDGDNADTTRRRRRCRQRMRLNSCHEYVLIYKVYQHTVVVVVVQRQRWLEWHKFLLILLIKASHKPSSTHPHCRTRCFHARVDTTHNIVSRQEGEKKERKKILRVFFYHLECFNAGSGRWRHRHHCRIWANNKIKC